MAGFANRYGLKLEITSHDTSATVTFVEFANEVSLDLSGDISWATGYQSHRKAVGFNNPIEGTLKISTQLVTTELLNIVSGGNGANTNTIKFNDGSASEEGGSAVTNYFTIKGVTVWVDEAGGTKTETITCHKACPKKTYNVTYSGEGDPQSIDIEFELLADGKGDVVTIQHE